MKNKSRVRYILPGVLLLLGAVAILLNQLGLLGSAMGALSFWQIFWSVALVVVFCSSVAGVEFFPMFLSAGILFYIHQEWLNLPEHLSFWPVFLIAALAATGCHLLFQRKHWSRRKQKEWVKETSSDEIIHERCLMSGRTKYIHAPTFKEGHFKATMGAFELFFDGDYLPNNRADIYLECLMGGVEIHVPRTWRVDDSDMTAIMGGVDKRREPQVATDAPTLYLHGRCTMGGVEVRYN